jgi:hypothetical protein
VGYDHFGSNSCVLFEDAEVEAWNAQQFNPLQVLARIVYSPTFALLLIRTPPSGSTM